MDVDRGYRNISYITRFNIVFFFFIKVIIAIDYNNENLEDGEFWSMGERWEMKIL